MMSGKRRTMLFATSGFLLFGTLFFSLFLNNLHFHMAHAAGIAPTIQYTPVQDPVQRSLILVNNPEAIHGPNDPRITPDPNVPASTLGDLLDTNRSIYTSALQAGSYRDVFDHINGIYLNNTNVPLGYGILLYNSGSAAVTLSVEGTGFVRRSDFAQPLANVLNTEETTAPQIFTLNPGEKHWLLQEDAYVNSVNPTVTPAAIGPRAIFSGAADFTINGPLTIYHLAYSSGPGVPEVNPDPTKLVYEGYVKRIERTTLAGNPCPLQPPLPPLCFDTARVYKGMTQHVTAVTTKSVNFLVDSNDMGKTLPVQYPVYTQQGNQYAPSTTIITQPAGWYTNSSPGQIGENPKSTIKVVSNDMVPFTMPAPDSTTIDPLTPSDGRSRYPNIANWGIMYTIHGTFGNLSTDTLLSVNFNITAPSGAPVTVAYQAADGKGKWQSLSIPAGTTQPLHTIIVPTSTDTSLGQATYNCNFILGLPSGGPVTQSFSVAKAS